MDRSVPQGSKATASEQMQPLYETKTLVQQTTKQLASIEQHLKVTQCTTVPHLYIIAQVCEWIVVFWWCSCLYYTCNRYLIPAQDHLLCTLYSTCFLTLPPGLSLPPVPSSPSPFLVHLPGCLPCWTGCAAGGHCGVHGLQRAAGESSKEVFLGTVFCLGRFFMFGITDHYSTLKSLLLPTVPR